MSGGSDDMLKEQLRNGSVRLVIAIATLLGAALGTGGTVGLHYLRPELLREDPFRGSDWDKESAALQRQLAATKLEHDLLEQRVEFEQGSFLKHEEDLKAELHDMRLLLKEVSSEVKNISRRLDDLPPEWRRRIEVLEDHQLRTDPSFRKAR